jgi:hypothetical protein
MAATATPTLTGLGAPIGELHSIGDVNMYLVPFTTTMSNSYATGGDTLTLPNIKGKVLRQVIITASSDGTRLYNWNQSATAPTIIAYSALGTQVTAATDLHTTTITGILVYGG